MVRFLQIILRVGFVCAVATQPSKLKGHYSHPSKRYDSIRRSNSFKICSEPVVIVGGGVMGLTCALRLLERGYNDVTIVNDSSKMCCSKSSAAVIRPAWMGPVPTEIGVSWGKESFQEFAKVFREVGSASGILPIIHYEYYKEEAGPQAAIPDEILSQTMDSWRNMTEDELSSLFPQAAGGFAFSTFTVDGREFVPYLQNLCKSKGMRYVEGVVEGQAQTLPWCQSAVKLAGRGGCRTVVNCCGLKGGTDTYPIRGDLILVKCPGMKIAVGEYKPKDGTKPFYCYPRKDCLVLGATYLKDNGSKEIDDDATDDLLKRAAQNFPELRNAKVISPVVCIRPARKLGPRIDTVKAGFFTVVNNYGHGGGGWSVAYGCATKVAGLVESVTLPNHSDGLMSRL